LRPSQARHGVNLGNFDPAIIASVRVRKFDGADTWKFFDELATGDQPHSADQHTK